MLMASSASLVYSGSTGRAGARTEALATIYIATSALPHFPPSPLDDLFDVPDAFRADLARSKEAAEQAINSGGLEDARFAYQSNLLLAFGKFASAAGYELGGHGYVTDHWEQNLFEWIECARKQSDALRKPLGPPAPDTQLLNLLDRLNSVDVGDYLTKPLTKGKMVRIRNDDGSWSGTLKLTADPKRVDEFEAILPSWELSVIDRNDNEETYVLDRRSFEPAPLG